MAGTGAVTLVDVRTHQQNEASFCGMATAMMVLNSLNKPLSEDFLRRKIEATVDSSAPPDHLASAIDTLKPASNLTFGAIPYGSWDAANEAIVRTLFDARVPVAAQVLGKDHWLVVCGVRTDVSPKPGTPYTFEGVFVGNPTPTPSGKRSQPHSDDDACGNQAGCGALHEFISPDDWKSRFPGTRDGKFVCVTASGPVPLRQPAVSAAATFQGPDPAQAAIDGIKAFALDSQGPCAPFLQDAVAGAVQSVGTFSLVTIRHPDGTDAGYARVATDGTFLGVQVSRHLHPILSADQISVCAAPQLAALPPSEFHDAPDSRRPASPYSVSGPFWRPCLESPSPYYPLYQIEAKDLAGRTRTLYATFEGKVHPWLTWFDVPPPARSAVARKVLRYLRE